MGQTSSIADFGITTLRTGMAETDELRDEYCPDDLGKGVRGKYYERYRQDANDVLPDQPTETTTDS